MLLGCNYVMVSGSPGAGTIPQLRYLCEQANTALRDLAEMTLASSGNSPPTNIGLHLKEAIMAFRRCVEAVATVPATTPAELAMKGRVVRGYLSDLSDRDRGLERRLLDSLIADAIYVGAAWGHPDQFG